MSAGASSSTVISGYAVSTATAGAESTAEPIAVAAAEAVATGPFAASLVLQAGVEHAGRFAVGDALGGFAANDGDELAAAALAPSLSGGVFAAEVRPATVPAAGFLFSPPSSASSSSRGARRPA